MSNSKYAVNRPDVIDEKFDEEYVIVNLRDGTYYGLNPTGAIIWGQLAAGASPAEIVTNLEAQFDAAKTPVESAVENFLRDLEQEGLILAQASSIEGEPPTPAQAISEPRTPFQLPALEKFTDMREVLQMDPIHEVDDTGWPARENRNMKLPLVSVIIPVLNAARFLGDALASVGAQTYPALEIVVIDGPSTDETPRIAQAFPRVRYLKQMGTGMWNALNQGLDSARGEFAAMISSDDLVPDKLQMQVEYLLAHPETNYVFCLTKFVLIPGETAPRAFRAELFEGDRLAILLEALLARKTLLERVGKFDETLRIASDVDWFARLANLQEPRGMIERGLLYKRIHASNLSTEPTLRNVFKHDVLTAMRTQMQRQHALRAE